MSWGYYGWRPYVSVAEKKANAARQIAKLTKKCGQPACPVVLEGRKIATTFWGKAWCDNLESYSDYENRLPRGRSYVRNGSVMDLQISTGKVTALVAGSELYKIQVNIKPLKAALWKKIQAECAGKIDSLIELLQGKLSSAVMEIVTRHERGLFPTPSEISLDCSCPDWADLCKHVAASLYGVGARLDLKPELLFLLRGVDPADLISKASAAEAVRQTRPATAPTLADSELADVFGIELAAPSPAVAPTATPTTPVAAAPTPAPKPPLEMPKVVKKKPARRKMSVAGRAHIAAAAKARWQRAKGKAKLANEKFIPQTNDAAHRDGSPYPPRPSASKPLRSQWCEPKETVPRAKFPPRAKMGPNPAIDTPTPSL